METFPLYWPFVRGIHWSPVNSPHKGQWRGSFMFFIDLRHNKRGNKQSWCRLPETSSHSLWRHCNDGKALSVGVLIFRTCTTHLHYDDVIMTMLESQITSLTVVYSIVYTGVHQRKHQSSASLAFVREIHRGPVNFPHKWPVTRKMFPFDDVIMSTEII